MLVMFFLFFLQIQKQTRTKFFQCFKSTGYRPTLGWHNVVHKKVPKEWSYKIS